MNQQDDGGPAFPVVAEQYDYGHERVMPKQVAPGMTLRDYFAAKAMQAQCITDLVPGEAADALVEAAAEADQDPIDRLALNSYKIADAMLKARDQ